MNSVITICIRMLSKIQDLLQDKKGATMVEYSLLVGLIAAIAVAAVMLIGSDVSMKFNKVAPSIK